MLLDRYAKRAPRRGGYQLKKRFIVVAILTQRFYILLELIGQPKE